MVQRAAIAALQCAGDDVMRMKSIYDERRKFMIRRLKEIGLGITVEPTGAFYVFANAKRFSSDSYQTGLTFLRRLTWASLLASTSAKTARATCGSPTRVRWRISRRP